VAALLQIVNRYVDIVQGTLNRRKFVAASNSLFSKSCFKDFPDGWKVDWTIG